MTIEVVVRGLEKGFRKEIIEIEFNGQLDMGEKFNMIAEYNMEGQMTTCSSAYSSRNSADYYIEIAEVFKMMKNLEGEKILKVIDKVRQKKQVFEVELEEINEGFKKVNEEFKPFRDQYDEINGKLKRARTEKSIKKYKDEISKIEPDYVRLLNKRDELNKKYDDIYREMNRACRIKIA